MASVNRFAGEDLAQNARAHAFQAQQTYEQLRAQILDRDAQAQATLPRRRLFGPNYGMGMSVYTDGLTQARPVAETPKPPPVPAGPAVLYEADGLVFERGDRISSAPSWDRIYAAPLPVTARGGTPSRAKGFKLFELPDCCATIVASGFGVLPPEEFTGLWARALPSLAAKFGYTRILLSTTEAGSIPKDSPFKAISSCVNSRTNNTVTLFEADTGLTYADLHPRD